MTTPPRTIDIRLATREASRSAHRWRDAAASQYDAGNYAFASRAKKQKDYMYALKDAGIVRLHLSGLLRYIGASPQGMAVYEYGDGGMSCLHSTLHPDGQQRTLVEGHPEVLLVAAKKAKARIMDVLLTLDPYGAVMARAEVYPGYSRSSSPSRRAPITCYECGEEGHIARYCPEREEDDFDEPWPEVRA
jgi:Zinc knuckle